MSLKILIPSSKGGQGGRVSVGLCSFGAFKVEGLPVLRGSMGERREGPRGTWGGSVCDVPIYVDRREVKGCGMWHRH